MEETVLTKNFKRWAGHQIRILEPNDEGLYSQGNVIDVSVTSRHDGFLDLHFKLDWMAKSIPGSGKWELHIENNSVTIGQVTLEKAEHLATFGKCVFPSHELTVCFIPPNSSEWIYKPQGW